MQFFISRWGLTNECYKRKFISIVDFHVVVFRYRFYETHSCRKNYVGVWQYFHKVETTSRVDIKSIILIINSNSSAIYKTCSVVVTKESIARRSLQSSIFFRQCGCD